MESQDRLSVLRDDAGAGVVGEPGVATTPASTLQLHAAVFNSLADAAIVTDSNLIIRSINPAAQTLFGLDTEHSIGLSVAELLEGPQGVLGNLGQDFSAEAISENLRQILAGEPWAGQLHHRNAQGEWIDTEAFAAAIELGDDTQCVLLVARDVTTLTRAAARTREQTRFAEAVLESLPGRTCVIDSDGIVITVNRQYREKGPAGTGVGSGPQLGGNYLKWIANTVDIATAEQLREVLDRQRPDLRAEFSATLRRKRTWTEILAVPLTDEVPGAVVTHIDITERKITESTLTRRATHDSLTSLPNRVLLADRLAQALSRAARTKSSVGLLFCDLDNFRDINNSLGHLAGDKLLVTVAQRLRAVCRSSDTVARVSGDEFVIILEDVTGREEIEEVARRIIEALAEPVALEQGSAQTGTSIGLVISSGVPRAGVRTVENLIRDADAAMYAAKEGGRGRYAWFVPEMRDRPRERPTFVQAIGRLLAR